MSSGTAGGLGLGVGMPGGSSLAVAQQGQGIAALLVMVAVLCFIFAYCCWGAPFCKSWCRKYCCCRFDDPEPDSRFENSEQTMVATPTIILLPHGRMLVVDGTIFTQFQADPTGLDLVELGENVIRAQRHSRYVNRHQLQSSQGSILEMDAETPSKDSMGSIGIFPPPTYESIYGKNEGEMPPSYSDILLHRFANLPYEIELQDRYTNSKEDIEMHSLGSCSHIVNNPMSNVAYHPYATIASFSSESFPRSNISRNSSVVSNPMDNFYINNELGGIYAINHMDGRMQYPRRPILNEEQRHRSELNSSNHSQNPLDMNRRSNETVNIINVDIHNNRAGITESTGIDIEAPRFPASGAINEEVTVNIDPSEGDLNGRISRQAMRVEEMDNGIGNDQGDNDFGALPDIRESRV